MDKTHVYSSMLKTLHSESARHLLKERDGEGFEFGKLSHVFFLEPKRFKDEYMEMPDIPEFSPISAKTKKDYGSGGKGKDYTRTIEWKEQRKLYLESVGVREENGKFVGINGKHVVSKSDMESLKAIKKNAEKDFPILFDKYLAGGKAEYSIVNNNFRYVKKDGVDMYIPAKCRLDYVIEFEDHVVVVDAKSTKCAHPKAFKYDILKYGYDIQEAWYTDMAEAHFGKPVKFLFFVYENQFPYNVCFYDTKTADKTGYEWGKEKVDSVIEQAYDVIQGMPKKGYVKQDTIVSI